VEGCGKIVEGKMNSLSLLFLARKGKSFRDVLSLYFNFSEIIATFMAVGSPSFLHLTNLGGKI